MGDDPLAWVAIKEGRNEEKRGCLVSWVLGLFLCFMFWGESCFRILEWLCWSSILREVCERSEVWIEDEFMFLWVVYFWVSWESMSLLFVSEGCLFSREDSRERREEVWVSGSIEFTDEPANRMCHLDFYGKPQHPPISSEHHLHPVVSENLCWSWQSQHRLQQPMTETT